MPADILEQRFVAVREGAWHRLGKVFPDPIPPSEAVRVAQLDLGVRVLPLVVVDGHRQSKTGMIAVGRWKGDRWETYGVASVFEVLPLKYVLPSLDALAKTYPLSAAGTLANGSEVFFTLSAGESKIAGEQYREWLVYRHSYRPGVANTVMWTPERVVCRNTLITGKARATFRLSVAHLRGVGNRTTAALWVADTVRRASHIRERLERLARVRLSAELVDGILRRVYAPLFPRELSPPDAGLVVDTGTLEVIARPRAAQRQYAENFVALARAAYERFNDAFPRLGGTAYALYQAVVESADHRLGRRSAAEPAVVGARALEKARAWTILQSLN